MSTPAYRTECIEAPEAQSRDLETKAGELQTQAGEARDLAAGLRRIWNLPSMATPTAAFPVPLPRDTTAPPPPVAPPGKTAAKVTSEGSAPDRAEARATVLKAAQGLGEAFRMGN